MLLIISAWQKHGQYRSHLINLVGFGTHTTVTQDHYRRKKVLVIEVLMQKNASRLRLETQSHSLLCSYNFFFIYSFYFIIGFVG